jgi:hypothetical protein
MAWRARQQLPEPPPSRAALRQEAALDRLQRLARGTGLTIVGYEPGRFAIVGKLERIEAIIELMVDWARGARIPLEGRTGFLS